MTKRSKFVQQRPTLLCEGLHKVSKLHASAGEKLACRTEGFSTADLELDNFRASLTSLLRVCILSRFCSDHLQGGHLGSFFRSLHMYIFAEVGLSVKSAKICTQRKFPTIRYTNKRSHDRHTENPAVHGLTRFITCQNP